MKSKVKFELDVCNKAIIQADIIHTDDVRDKIASQFREAFGHESILALCSFHPNRETPDGTVKTLQITPLHSDLEAAENITLFIPDLQVGYLTTALRKEIVRRSKMEESTFFGQLESKMKPSEELEFIYQRLGELLGLKENEKVANSYFDKDNHEFKLTKYGYEMVHHGFLKQQ